MEYEIRRSKRKTVALQLFPDGKLLVRCPMLMKDEEVHSFVCSKLRWLDKHRKLLSVDSVPQPMTPDQLQELKQRAAQQIPPRVAQFAAVLGVTYGRITIRAQRTRWGSCSGKGNLNFNCLLLLAPSEVLDYVVVHELCHRLEMNHSARFWLLVERILPDYRTCRQWLKTHGAELVAQMK